VICRIKACEKRAAEGIHYCGQCGEFPCAHVLHLAHRYRTKYATNLVENLLRIQEEGIAAFVESENRKWTCPGCGGMLCMHEPRCPACGFVWRS
jgi:rubrerythrin